ncbi:hypothetical protein JB92DRAFT_2904676 [Gautieria morchelliformis]|nr:hypothetical protein JB92DRAFT_2904676 [Gautieria morchelliformis]
MGDKRGAPASKVRASRCMAARKHSRPSKGTTLGLWLRINPLTSTPLPATIVGCQRRLIYPPSTFSLTSSQV